MTASADVGKMLAGLRAYNDKVRAAALAAVDQFGAHVLGDAQQLCPVKTGFLQASASELPAQLEGEHVTKQIGFNATYAGVVHENLKAHHPVGQAKYLETAIRNNAPKFPGFVASRIKQATGG